MTDLPLTRSILAAALLAALAGTAAAQGVFIAPPPGIGAGAPLVGPRADLARELPRYGYGDVDVRRLSGGQVAHIYSLMYSGRSEGDIRGGIGATLRRGFLQRGFDRLTDRTGS